MHNYDYVLPRSGSGYLQSRGPSPFQPDNVYSVYSVVNFDEFHIKQAQEQLEKMHSVVLMLVDVSGNRCQFREVDEK